MPLFDDEASNRVLDNDYGSSHGTLAPDSFTVHLYDGDPRDTGEEIVGDGYSAKTVTNNSTVFPAASEGKKTSAYISFGTADGDWPTVRWWLLKDAATGDPFECCEFRRPLDVPAGSPCAVSLVIRHDPEAE